MIRETENLTPSPAFVEQPTARDVENSRPLHRRIAELPDDSGEKAFRSKLPDDSGETMPDKSNLRSFNERKPGDLTEEEIKTLQEWADRVAREYNDKFSPYERACAKGIEGVTKTPNGGVSFENSDALYVAEDGKKGVVTIEATGNRSADFDKANKELGLPEKPDGYTWHHVDNYNVRDNTVTLELVRDEAHNKTKPHSGGCAQYDAVYGSSYNPPKKQ